MAYDAVIVPSMKTMRGSTLVRLERFSRAGGHIIFAGAVPELVDGEPSERVKHLASECGKVELTGVTYQLLDGIAKPKCARKTAIR